MTEAILIGLAAWRLSSLLVMENGPWGAFERLRTLVGIKPGPIEGFLPELLSCMFCTTVWATVFFYGVWQLSPTVVMVCAAMSIALLAERLPSR